MSFFDDASLVLLTSGAAGKDGKAYSMKPTDGSGDFTFTRGSNLSATLVDSNGLIEKGRENLLLQSNQFDTTWALIRTNISGGQSGYDGSTDAWLFQPTSVTPAISQSVSNSGVGTYSVYAKANSVNWIRLQLGGSPSPSVYFDLDPNTIGNRIGTQANNIDASIQDIGSGWFRCSVTFSSSVTSALIFPAKDDNVVGDINSTIYIQDAQLEVGLAATEYIESGASTGKAGLLENEPRFDYSGGATCPSLLLEPSRSNIVINSEYLKSSGILSSLDYDTNTTISPEGYQNASTLTLGVDSSSTRHRNLFSVSSTAGQTYTFSAFFKEADAEWIQLLGQTTGGVFSSGVYVNFNVRTGAVGNVGSDVLDYDIIPFGNGWYRCWISATTLATATGYMEVITTNNLDSGRYPSYQNLTPTDYMHSYGFQVEAGSYPTSYIPNHSGGSVTRAQDIADLNPLDQTYGDETTWFFEIERVPLDSEINQYIAVIINSSTGANNRMSIMSTSSGRMRILITDENGNSDNLYSANNGFVRGTTIKCAIKVTTRDTFLFIDGASVDTSVGLGVITGLDRINYIKDSIIKQFIVFPTALSDANCIALTS